MIKKLQQGESTKGAKLPFTVMLTLLALFVARDAHQSLAQSALPPVHPNRTLTFADRVFYQRAIERVYWRHRLWAANNVKCKPTLDDLILHTQMQKRVEAYLENSEALEKYWCQPVTPHELQAEMERMASHTHRPEVLRELFEALDNDPLIIAECLARPTLVERRFQLLAGLQEVTKTSKQLSDLQQADKTPFSAYTLPQLSTGSSCTEDTWTATSTVNATARTGHSAVWTGNELIVWGGNNGTYLNSGDKYNPATDTWTAISTTGAPSARTMATAVWTGTEMIVWGGFFQSGPTPIFLNTGAKYDPGTDSWTTTSTTNAPSPRLNHTAVWTGTEMIVWGGENAMNQFSTGGRYNPSTNSWTATSGGLDGRTLHSAVWTGSEMIIWGGGSNLVNFMNTGGRYSPASDSWVPTSTTNAPSPRTVPVAVWTGSEMVVWSGGFFDGTFQTLNTGGKYDPATDSWAATSLTNVPSRRIRPTAIWTDDEMIVWGGQNEFEDVFNTGGRYDPALDSWVATSTTDAPLARIGHTAVWTGSEMIVWGGGGGVFFNTGGRYCVQPSGPTPTPTSTPGATSTPTPTPTPTANPSSTPTPTPTTTPPARAFNMSTRMRVDTGNNVLIGGFIITGAESATVAIRGVGPSLAAFGVPDALADPTLTLRDSAGAVILVNDDWQSDPTQAAQLSALGLGLQDPRESGLISTVPAGSYTSVVAGKNNGTGIGLVEIYNTNEGSNSELANISARGLVLTGSNVMIGGFILGGNNNTHVVVRGIGPSLAQFGVPNFLADPTLELYDGNGSLLVVNDNWQDDPVSASQLTTLGLGLQDSAESGIYTSLAPGAFTAILAGNNDGVGIGLVEIYNVH